MSAEHHQVTEVRPEARVSITVDGVDVEAVAGQTIAAALLTNGQRAFRLSSRSKEPRSIYCGMGVCFECLVTVNGRRNVRACVTPVREGQSIETQRGNPGVDHNETL